MRNVGMWLKHILLAIAGLALPYLHRLAVVVALTLSVTAIVTERALAWGDDGHRVISDVANRRLSSAAAHVVRELLLIENKTTLSEVATWADDIKSQRPNTRPWHYVDIPISATGYDRNRDCARSQCIIAKIAKFRAVLGDKTKSAEARLEALKFLVHFIGDLHQPLHCSDNGDRGGNEIPVHGYGPSRNLHAVWDTGIIREGGLAEPDTARKLDAKITDAEDKAWERWTVIDWANESHDLAKSFVYAHRPDGNGNLPQGYQQDAEPIVEIQLEKAGVRLAALLNDTLR